MGVKVFEEYAGRWYIRVVYQGYRKTKCIGSRERAMEVSRKLTTALELYGFDALKMFDQDAQEPAPKPVLIIPTIDEYQKKWLAELEKTDVKRSTKELYSYLISNHVVPVFGKDQIDTIDYPKLKVWVIDKSEKYAKDTVRLMVATL